MIAKRRLPRFPSSVIESARLRSRPCMRNEKKPKRQTFFCLTSFSLASFLVMFIDIDQLLFLVDVLANMFNRRFNRNILENEFVEFKFNLRFVGIISPL